MGEEDAFARVRAEIGAQHRADALANLGLLEDTVAKIADGDLDPALRERARSACHKLRGSLGVFGLRRAGEIAGSIEDELAAEGPIPREKAPELAGAVRALRGELEA